VLRPGDKLCLYTDGVTECRNEIGEMFGQERLTGCLTTHGMLPASGIIDDITACQSAFCGTQAAGDDVTLLVMELTGP
jgi:phosphoserine phosphatase RsbU/P